MRLTNHPIYPTKPRVEPSPDTPPQTPSRKLSRDQAKAARVEAARVALPLGPNQDVDQGEEPGKPGNDESVERVTTRRFPAPWSVRELEQAFRIEDANGQAVAYTYFRRDENEARQANVLTYDEARRIAANVVKLPELLRKEGE